jgi:hypothetical protein
MSELSQFRKRLSQQALYSTDYECLLFLPETDQRSSKFTSQRANSNNNPINKLSTLRASTGNHKTYRAQGKA